MELLCAYCERTLTEVALEDKVGPTEALDFFLVRKRRVLLCHRCHRKHAPKAQLASEVDMDEPVDFPPGITRVGHICPSLILQGLGEDDATVSLTLEPAGDYLMATCPHCGVTVRSLHAEPELDEDGDLDY